MAAALAWAVGSGGSGGFIPYTYQKAAELDSVDLDLDFLDRDSMLGMFKCWNYFQDN